MASQLRGGGGVVPDLNLPPPPEDDDEQAPPRAAGGGGPHLVAAGEGAAAHPGLPPAQGGDEAGDGLQNLAASRVQAAVAVRHCDSILGIHIRPAAQGSGDGGCGCPATHVRADQIAPLVTNELRSRGRGPGPGRRLLRFSLLVDDAQTRPADFDSLLDYAADCRVEHVKVVDARRRPAELATEHLLTPGRAHASALPELSFNFQRASRHLMRLSLSGVAVNEARRTLSQFRSIPTLEVLTVQYTSLGDLDLGRILLSCRRLRILVLRTCRGLTCVNVTAASERMTMLAVLECPQVDKISASTALRLRSFRYSGAFPRSVALPKSCFVDLYICFTNSRVSRPIRQCHTWLNALPNLSTLVVLTICSNALVSISILRAMGNFQPQVAKLCNLPSLGELQLVLYKMNTLILSQVYKFFGMCHCPRLRNLFVELPEVNDESFTDAVSELAQEPPMDGFKNLVHIKITNFKWQCNEIELVNFLLRKVSSLQKVIVILVPKGTIPELDQSGNAIFPDANLPRFENCPANVKVVVLNERLGAKFREFHRDVFWEFF